MELAEKDAVRVIKAQRDDVFRKIPELAHYYIVLCAYEPQLKKRLNAVRAEFLGAAHTTVVSPVQALKFFRYDFFQIDAKIKLGMDESDVVLREMRQALEGFSETAKALVCYMSARVITHGVTTLNTGDLYSDVVGRMYRRIIDEAIRDEQRRADARAAEEEMYNLGDEIDERLDDDEDSTLAIASLDPITAVAVDLEQLEGEFIEQSQNGNSLSLLISQASPVVAVVADAIIRYGYSADDVVPYLLELAGVEQ